MSILRAIGTKDREPNAPGQPAAQGKTPVCVPQLSGNELLYIKHCIDSNWVSSVGPFVDRFEEELAEYVGARFAVATVNGTAALHTALLLAGVRADDEVLVSTFTFIAPVNAISYCQAHPVFIDADPSNWQMDPQLVSEFLENSCEIRDGETYNLKTGRRVRAMLPVHVLGHPCDLDRLEPLARRYKLTVVEDAAESLGASYRGHSLGSSGRLTCFSFNGNKLITSGGGGMLVTDSEVLAKKARYLTTQAKESGSEMIHGQVGYNYRLTNVQAAMGCAQLEQIGDFLDHKRKLAATYEVLLSDIPGITPMPQAPWAQSSYWLYTILVDPEHYGMDSRALIGCLAQHGILAQPRWQPIHLSPAHSGQQFVGTDVAEHLYRRCVTLPCSVGLTLGQATRIAELIRSHRCNRADEAA